MANQTSFARIGLTVLAGTAAIVATLIYIGGIKDSGPETLIETYYNKPVNGLSEGSAVNLRGVRIGEVRKIGFIGNHYDVDKIDCSRIYILMSLSHEKLGIDKKLINITEDMARRNFSNLVSKGLRATVASSGITGLSHIELDFYPPEKRSDIEQIPWTPKYIFVPPQLGFLDSFSESATKVMNQINRMDLNLVFSNVNNSVESIAKATDSLKSLMEVRQADLENVFNDLTETVSSVRELTTELKRNPSLLIRNREPEALPETER